MMETIPIDISKRQVSGIYMQVQLIEVLVQL